MLNYEYNRLNTIVMNRSLSQSVTDNRNRLHTIFYTLWARLLPFYPTLERYFLIYIVNSYN